MALKVCAEKVFPARVLQGAVFGFNEHFWCSSSAASVWHNHPSSVGARLFHVLTALPKLGRLSRVFLQREQGSFKKKHLVLQLVSFVMGQPPCRQIARDIVPSER